MNPLRGSSVSECSRCGAARFFYVAREPCAEIVSNRSRCGAVRISKLADEPSAEIVRVESLSLRCGAVRISKLADEPSAEIVRVESLSPWRRANLKARGRALCGDCACRIALAVAPCELFTWPASPLRRLCVSDRSRCGAVRISKLADEPSAEIVRVGSLSLWRRANFLRVRRTLCGDCACRIALAVAPCEFSTWPTNPLRRLCASDRSRCGAVLFFLRRRRTLCGDCACRIALAVAPCEFQSSPTNPLRRLCVSNCSRCGAVRISKLADEPSAEICACRIALAVVFAKFQYKSSTRSTLPQLRPENRKF